MVGPVDDLSDESFLEDAARSYNMDQVATLDAALLKPSNVYLLKIRLVDCTSLLPTFLSISACSRWQVP